jgi:hypothetical protein
MYIDGLKIGVTHQSHRPYPEMPDERPHEVPDFFSFRLNQQPFHDIALCSCRAWALDRCVAIFKSCEYSTCTDIGVGAIRVRTFD